MGIGREVADAYISVHGDMSPFREELGRANAAAEKEAKRAADTFGEEWGKRMKQQVGDQWQSIANAMYSGKKLDFNRMIEAFDSTSLDEAQTKLNSFMLSMRRHQKLTAAEYAEMKAKINETINAMKEQEKQMKLLHDAQVQGIADNDKYNRSFEGIFKANKLADITRDFHGIARAMNDNDWSKFAKGFEGLDQVAERVSHVTDLMHEQGLISEENSQNVRASIRAYIDAENAKIQAMKEAADEARRLREEQEKYNRSLEGMTNNHGVQRLENDFRNLSAAMDSNDWSGIARGSRSMDELRQHTIDTVTEMHNLGRATDADLERVHNRLREVTADQDRFNLSFRNGERDGVSMFTRLRTLGNNFHSVLLRLGTATKGFREHLGGFAGLNIFQDLIKEGLDFIHNLDRIAVSAATATLKLTTMGALAGAGLSSAITIAGDLGATLGGLAAAAPAFGIGIGIGVAVLVSALRDYKTQLKSLAPIMHKFQDDISRDFWSKAKGPIVDMVKTLVPILDNPKGTSTAASLGTLVGKLATALKNIPADKINTMFDRMNRSIDILGGAMGPLISAFTNLGMIGSQYFERFATWLVELSVRFDNFIAGAAADGRLAGWIDNMIQGFQDIFRAIDGIFGIFNALDAAASAAGFGGLKTFADNLQAVAAGMQSAGAQTAFIQLMSGMLIFAEKVGAALGNLGEPLASIMPTINLALAAIGGAVATVIGYIGEILRNPTVQSGITNFTNGIRDAVDKLAPAISPFADSLGNVMTLLGLILVNVAEIVSAFTVQLSPILDGMSTQIQSVMGPLKDSVLGVIDALGPVLQSISDNLLPPLIDGINNYLLPAFDSMITTLAPIAAEMIAALGPVLDSILPLIPPIFDLATTIGSLLGQAVIAVAPLFEVLVTALMPVVDAIIQLVDMVAPFLIPAIQQIAEAVAPVIEVLGQVVGFILSILVPILGFLLIGIINNVVGVFQGLSNFIMGFVEIVTAIFTGFGQFFTKLFEGDIGGALGALGTMFADIWDGIVKMLGGALEFLWNAVQLLFIGKLIGGIKSGLSSIGAFFKSAWDDIVNGVSRAFGTMQNGVSSGLNAIGNFFRSGWDGMVNIVRNAFNWIVDAVSSGIGNVMNWVTGIPGKISGALSGLGNLLSNAGKAIIDGLLNGLKSAWGAVTSFVGGIADWIAKNKGPLPYDRQLLVPAGKAIMQGLQGGLVSEMGNLKNTVTDVTDVMSDTVTAAFAHSKMFLAGADAAKGLASGLGSERSTVLDALGAITPAANLTASVSGIAGAGGVAAPTPVAGKVITVESGAISLVSNVADPQIAAAKVLDGLINSTTF